MITLSKLLRGSQGLPKATCLILAALFAAALHSTHAATLYSTGFEDPPFANGSELVGQDGWTGVPFLSPSAAIITNSVAKSGLQSVQVRGADMVDAFQVDPLAAVGSYRKPLNYDAGTGVPVVHLQADVRLDGNVIGTGDLFSANLAGRSGDGGNFELSISSDGMVYGYDNDGIIYSAPISLNAWHTLGITIDFAANTQTFVVDGIPSSPFAFSAGFTSDVLLRESLVALAFPDAGEYKRSDFTAYFDNVSAESVPESGSSAVLLTFGCLALMGVYRRQICS
ncbi:MAG: hypothetical protein ABI680_17900 [Chthoniobacteraceae bacterium]